MTDWSIIARQTVERVALTLPDDMPFKERKAAIDAAYPFGERAYWPYKAWLKARKTYLTKFGPVGRIPPAPLFPDFEFIRPDRNITPMTNERASALIEWHLKEADQ